MQLRNGTRLCSPVQTTPNRRPRQRVRTDMDEPTLNDQEQHQEQQEPQQEQQQEQEQQEQPQEQPTAPAQLEQLDPANIMMFLAQTIQSLQQQQQQTIAMMQEARSGGGNSSNGTKAPLFHGYSKGDLTIDQFLFRIEMYYHNKEAWMLENNNKFVKLVANTLRDDALDWYQQYVAEMKAKGETTTWDSFKEQIIEHFQPKDHEARKIEKLDELEQKSTIHVYNAAFTQLHTRLEEPLSQLVAKHFYWKGLRTETKNHVKTLDLNTLEENMNAAKTYEDIHFPNGKGISKKPKPGPNNDTKPTKPDDKKKPGNWVPKEQWKGDKKWLSKEDWLKTITCHNCDEKGHLANQCPKAKQGNAKGQ